MDETTSVLPENHLPVAVDIVSAFVSNNVVPLSGLPALIASVHAALAGLGQGQTQDVGSPVKATPAQIKKSISHDALVSFEDGKSYKTLKRHLTRHGLSPEAYRAKHGLPHDYPMVSAAYSAQRSELARTLGLGQLQRKTYVRATEPKAPAETAHEKPKRGGRPGKIAKAAEG